MVNYKWSIHGKDRFCQNPEISRFPVLAGEQGLWNSRLGSGEERAASRPSRGGIHPLRWNALGMTTSGVLDDEALQLALKDASVKGKLSLAYLDLTGITSEQATRVRRRRTSPSWIYGRTTSRTCPMSSATSRRWGDQARLQQAGTPAPQADQATSADKPSDGGNLLSTVDALWLSFAR